MEGVERVEAGGIDIGRSIGGKKRSQREKSERGL